VKLIVEEPESAAIARLQVDWRDPVTSMLGEIETYRAVRRAAAAAEARTATVLAPVAIVPLDESVRALALAVEPPALRALDAIHLATALSLGEGLEAVVTYDARLAAAAEAAGLTVLSPS
jgi:predicted nucleic acid-binding protein